MYLHVTVVPASARQNCESVVTHSSGGSTGVPAWHNRAQGCVSDRGWQGLMVRPGRIRSEARTRSKR